jgi:hypothetical protein
MCLGYGDWPAALYATEDDFHLLITSGNGARAMGSTSSVKCTAHQILNEFRIAYSAQAAIVLSQGCLPFEVVGRSTSLAVRRIISFQHGEV